MILDTNQIPSAVVGALVSSGVHGIVTFSKMFASPKDLAAMATSLRLEFAQIYVQKPEFEKAVDRINDKLDYITERLDQFFTKKG